MTVKYLTNEIVSPSTLLQIRSLSAGIMRFQQNNILTSKRQLVT